MLRRIEFENFMSLKDVGVDLRPLTVFIGPNGSGKSAIFKGLVVLSKIVNGIPLRGSSRGDFVNEAGVTLDDLVWNGNAGLPIKFRVWFDDDGDEPGYTLELGKRREGWSVLCEKIRTANGWILVDEDHPFKHPTERRGEKEIEAPMRGTLFYFVRPYIEDTAARPAIEPILQFAEKLRIPVIVIAQSGHCDRRFWAS